MGRSACTKTYLLVVLTAGLLLTLPGCQRRDGSGGTESAAANSGKIAHGASGAVANTGKVSHALSGAAAASGQAPPAASGAAAELLPARRVETEPPSFHCPGCAADGEKPASRGEVTRVRQAAPGIAPPGAPSSIEYARLQIDEHFSAFDVPVFLSLSSLVAGLGGRVATFSAKSNEQDIVLFSCMLKGSRAEDIPSEARPDPSDKSGSGAKVFEKRHKDADGLHYERAIYLKGTVHWVDCTIAPEHADYFLPIAQDMGASIGISGGIGAQN